MGILLGALDIGTQTTSLVAGEVTDGKLAILGRTETPTQGVKKGVIRDIDSVTAGIRRVCEAMSQEHRVDLVNVSTAFSCGDLRSLVRTGRVSLLPGHAINQDDIEAAEENAQSENAPDAPETLLQRFRQKYLVNDQLVVSPTGMAGAELKANVLELIAPRTALGSLQTAIHQAGLRLVDTVFSGLAAAEAVLDRKAQEDGAVVIDFGAGTVDYLAVCNGVIAAVGAIGVGGAHLTNDLALAFQVTQKQAEEMKLARGAAMIQPDLANARHLLRTTFSTNDRSVSVHAIQTVTTERVDETFRLVRDALRDVLPQVHGGIFLTGGTAALPLIADQASAIFGKPCSLGVPVNVANLPDALAQAPYRHATAVGILNWRCRMLTQETYRPTLLARLRAFLKG